MIAQAKVIGLIAAAVSAAGAAIGAESQGVGMGITVAISLLSSAICGGAAYGAMRNSLGSAHHRIGEEIDNRKEALGSLKEDMHLGFARMEASMDRNTSSLIAALRRPDGQRSRVDDF